METNCSVCGTPFTDPLQAFGCASQPLCWKCYSEMMGEYNEPVYGLGPHHHIIEENEQTGEVSIQTVFHDEDDPEFIPDPDAPGLGVWVRQAKGWK